MNNFNNWQEQQVQQRDKQYQLIEKMALRIRLDSQKFKEYLGIQSRFGKYSVGNCLIMLAEAPYTTQFKTKKGWQEVGVELKSDAKSFTILEPNKSEKNGKVYYNPKVMYDISETKQELPKEQIEYDTRVLLTAFLNNCYATVKAVDYLPNGRTMGTTYNKDENILYIARGMEKGELFQTLAMELANIEMRKEQDTSYKDFKSFCISYMLCYKYGIDVSSTNFSNIPNEIRGKSEGKEIREELDKIRADFERIDSRINEYFEKTGKEKSIKSKEER